MSSGPSHSRHSTGLSSKVRMLWPAWLCCLLLAACEPRTIEIEGLDELTREIRSQRLQTSLRKPTGTASPVVNGEQIQAALKPLRDVLTQMGTSQRDLSERHAALTLEMRRWTQLLVQSMKSGRSEEAKKLDQRLAELESTIIEQDSRHRQVEALIGSALDKTADQLEAFLNHFTGGSSPIPSPDETLPASDEPLKKGGGDTAREDGKVKTSNREQSSNRTVLPRNRLPMERSPRPPENVVVPSNNVQEPVGREGRLTNKRGEDMPNQQASMDWLWGLSVIALVSGSTLLFSRRRPRPTMPQVAMQFAPEAADSLEPAGSIDQPDTFGDLPTVAPTTADTDEAEVEELWAAAALLGEAIDRLKQTDDDAPPELGGAQALPDIPVNDFEPDTAIEPRSILDNEKLRNPSMTSETDVHPQELPAELRPSEEASSPKPPASKNSSQPETTPHRAKLASGPIPLTCQMHLPADKHAAGRVQRMLEADPRVLAHPEPTIRAEMGQLEINFALLPGLTAGERSILEQQVRDTGA